MLMQHGISVLHSSEIAEIIQAYYSEFESEGKSIFGNGKAKIENLVVKTSKLNDNNVSISKVREPITLDFDLIVDESIKDYFISITVYNMELRSISLFSTTEENIFLKNNGQKKHICAQTINYYTPGKYTFTIDIIEFTGKNLDKLGEILLSQRNTCEFISMGSKQTSYCPVQLPSKWEIT